METTRTSEMHHTTSEDHQTGLVTRSALLGAFAEAMDSAGPIGQVTAVLVALDDFRRVNDSFGYDAAVDTIRAIARTLAAIAHPGDVIGRLTPSSFGICCGHDLDDDLEQQYAARIRIAVGAAAEAATRGIHARVSVGTARSTGCTELPHELLHSGDIALSRAKDLGGNQTCTYDDSMRHRVHRRLELEGLITDAIDRREVTLAYQPVVMLDEQMIVGAEALLRMTEIDGRPLSAAEVIEVAEASGLMVELGTLILETACREAAGWQQALPEQHLTVSVNVSARQLDDERLPDEVARILDATGLNPARLCLEMTETALMADTDRSIRQLVRLKASGVTLSADDFGTGYSSLAYLKRFPLDSVKADLSFVAGLPDDAEDVAVVSAIMGIARALGLRVVAEGVETERQLDELTRLGCGFGQGYLWSRAIPGPELFALATLDHATRSAGSTARELIGSEVDPRPSVPPTMAAVDLALQSLAHELRTPLTVVLLQASMLSTSDADPVEAGRRIVAAAERMTRLISELDVVRAADDGRLVLDRHPLDLVSVVDRLVDDQRQRSPVPIVVRRGASIPLVPADRARLEQVIVNLLSNAVKFSPPGGLVEVRIDRAGDSLEVSVSDAGIGVSGDQLELIFRKYGRVEHSTPGAGLGLFIARSIARAHGGDVVFRRRGGGGSTFVLRLPQGAPNAVRPAVLRSVPDGAAA